MVFAWNTQGVALGCRVWALSGQKRHGAVPAISARRASHIAAQGNALGARYRANTPPCKGRTLAIVRVRQNRLPHPAERASLRFLL
jgi:hypothetical protein